MDTSQYGSLMTEILKAFCICGGLLLVGTFLRAKVKLFQNFYLPACVIGGFIGLLLSPTVMGNHAILNISAETNAILSNIPSVLFMLIMAAMPMCSASLSRKSLRGKGDVWSLAILITIIFCLQFAIGFGVNAAFTAAGRPTYAAFGAELAQGFTGGHSIAPMHGSMLQSLNQPYWETARGVTITVATVGIIAGIVWGVILINIAVRKGYTNYIDKPSSIPEEMRVGLYKSVEDQPWIGKQTTNSASIDSFAFHLALILPVVGAGYIINDLVQKYQVPVFKEFAAWVYMLIVMYIVWPIICKLKLDRHFNAETKSKITGTITEFIIVAAIVSIPLKLVMEYWLPILVTCVLGLLFTPLILWFGAKKFLVKDWAEKIMGPIGMNHGDFITGVLLIKMVDPNMKSSALEDFSLAYAIHNLYALPLFVFIMPYVINHGAVSAALVCIAQVIVLAILLVVCGNLFKKAGSAK
ncbi:hypothetical protein KQI82_14150 [Oscillibacter sp. MSJ-2]|uniref:Sodium:glutamate symporter n=1 Tax=Dysosmobacter acutus TaxID=2841504 RepID=A0ABS6FCQ8_9FIRM|nr:sodium/glutamate symporter [Dysosmobacter acutus]MBU5628051.1 hypothetical protein [Dysosmobacter acutus]